MMVGTKIICTISLVIFMLLKVTTATDNEKENIREEGCDRFLKYETGEVTSPNWPQKSVPYVACTYIIEVPANKRITFKFDQFVLEGADNEHGCDEDDNYVQISDRSLNRTERICGSQNPFTWTSQSNNVEIQFQAHSAYIFHLFRATFSSEDINTKSLDCGHSFFLQSFGLFVYNAPNASQVRAYIDVSNGQDLDTCQVFIHGHAGQQVSVTFLEVDAVCAEPIELFEPINKQATLICDDSIGVSWTSQTNEVVIIFTKNTTIALDLEFSLIDPPPASSEECSSLINIESPGSLLSPNYPAPYPSNLVCRWFLHADIKKIIILKFVAFSLEEHEECLNDFVQILDMTTTRVERYCGIQYPFSWISDSNEVEIWIQTNELLSFRGFQVVYSTDESNLVDCFVLANNVLTTPNHPAAYPADVDCFYILHDPKSDKGLILEFTTFDLEYEENCENDYLLVTDITSEYSERFCGRQPRFTMTTVSNEVKLLLHTNKHVQNTGFSLAYHEINKPIKNTAEDDCYFFIKSSDLTESQSDLFNEVPFGPKDCLYILHGNPKEFVTIVFKEFQIDEDLVNSTSLVTISDVKNSRDETFTVSQPSFTWQSTTNEVHVRITAPSVIPSVRIKAAVYFQERVNVDDVECLDLHTTSRGDLSFPLPGVNHGPCSLIIQATTFNRIILRFSKLEFTGGDCSNNFIEITDVTKEVTDVYCSNTRPFAWMSNGNLVQISVKNLIINSTVSLEATYLTIERPPETPYHQFLTTSSGIFRSAEHQQQDLLGQICSIVIRARADENIQIKFEEFLVGNVDQKLDKNGKSICSGKKVMIQDILDGRIDNLCGQSNVFSWTAKGNLVHLFFEVEDTVANEGFRASYKIIPTNSELEILSQPKGTIQSEDFPNIYPPNVRRKWVIHGDLGSLVTIVFQKFDLEESEFCNKDYVKMVDLATKEEKKLCGSQNVFAWTSIANEMCIEFVTDDTKNKTGFVANYEVLPSNYTAKCFHRLNGKSGKFTLDKTNRPTILDPPTDGICQMIIHSDPGSKIHLIISNVILDDCQNAGLVLTDTGSARTVNLCDVHNLVSWTSDTNEVFVNYVVYKDQLPTLSLKWTSVGQEVPPGCSRLITVPSNFTLTLEDLASTQPESVCHYLFSLPPTERAVVSMEYQFTAGNDCNLNYFKVLDPLSLRTTELCTTSLPFSWTSDSNEIFLTYHRSSQISPLVSLVVNFTSFHQVRALDLECTKTLDSENGIIESPNHPMLYPMDKHCDTLIHLNPSQRVHLTFESFNIEGNLTLKCTGDYLKITDVAAGRSDIICGHLHPFSWLSEGNEVMLQFLSDGFIELSGFHAVYKVLNRTETTLTACNTTLIEESGSLDISTEAFFTNGSSGPLLCLYNIHAHPDSRIITSFRSLRLEKDEECQKSFIEVLDLVSGRSDVICGEHSHYEWTSVGNEAMISFYVTNPDQVQSFRLEYKMLKRTVPKVCDKTFTSITSNEIQSEGYIDGYYDNNLDCSYTIIAGVGQLVQVTFDTLDVEHSEGCQNDYVKVESVGIGNPEQLCGIFKEYTWTSFGNVVLVTLHTDHVIRRPGFHATFDFIASNERLPSAADCDKSFNSATGTITSPNYGNAPYHNNLDCKFLITVKESKVVEINFLAFDLEYHPLCKYDYVEVKSEPRGLSSRFCGPETPPLWISQTNQVLVLFHTDASGVYKGFHLTFDTIEPPQTFAPNTLEVPHCKQQFNWHTGFLASPNFPKEYPNNEHCQVDIVTTNGTRIEITLYFIDIEEHYGCRWDYVQMKDMESNRVSEPLCGNPDKPYVWLSDSNHAVVIFRSDSMFTRPGFYGNFVEVPPASNQSQVAKL